MFPIKTINGAILDALILYIAILGVLLLVATWIRLKIPFLKKYHIPAALIAGLIGLLLGPHFLKVIPKEVTACWSALAGRLIVFVFAPIMMCGTALRVDKSLIRKVFGATCYTYALCTIQYAVPILLTIFIISPMFKVNPLFSTIVEQGWAGGHGTAGGMGMVFEELGWTEGQSLSVTSATIGLIFGIVGGVILINVGIRKGWTTFVKSSEGLQSDTVELYTENKPEDTHKAVAPGVIDNLAFHAALMSVAVIIGWIINRVLKIYLNFSIAWFITSMFGGLFVWLVIRKTPAAKAMDHAVFARIQGFSLEFLVAGAVSSINVPVVIEYAVPLLIQQSVMAVVMIFLATWYARRLFPEYWFENSLFYFGTFTGVMATGMLLLKTVDPQFESDTIPVLAARSPFCSWAVGGGLLTSMTPFWITKYGLVKTGIGYCAFVAAVLLLPVLMGCCHHVGVQKA
jgi:ESS family glutamate:Na+ symporter